MLTGSNKKKRHTMTAWPGRVAALIVVAALTAACFAGTVFAEGEDNEPSLSLTVSFDKNSGAIEQDEDLKDADLVVDLYCVASGEKDTGYDTYNLTAEAAFSELADAIADAQKKTDGGEAFNADQWKKITQSAAGIVEGAADSVDSIPGKAGTAIDVSKPGLYLVLTHNDLDKLKAKDSTVTSYFVDEEDGSTSTLALTNAYEYHFEPQLIFLPAKNHDAETGLIEAPGFETSYDWGDWVYDAEIILKPTQKERFGSIVVTKTLTGKDNHYRATFVFDVEATKTKAGSTEPVLVYSNVFSLNFDQDGAKSFTVEKIPVGAEVTVTEVYSGSSYILTTDRELTDTLKNSTEPLSFAFENKAGDGPGGYGILNTFTSDGENSWIWSSDAPQRTAN